MTDTTKPAVDLSEQFPHVNDGAVTVGDWVTIQMARPKRKTAGGIIIPDTSMDAKMETMFLAKVLSIGPNAETTYGALGYAVGDIVIVPKFGGLGYRTGSDDEAVAIRTLKADEIVRKVTDPAAFF